MANPKKEVVDGPGNEVEDEKTKVLKILHNSNKLIYEFYNKTYKKLKQQQQKQNKEPLGHRMKKRQSIGKLTTVNPFD